MALPIYGRSEWRCGVHPHLSGVHLVAWFARYVGRVHHRSSFGSQCGSCLSQSCRGQGVGVHGIYGSGDFHDYPRFLCRDSRLVLAVSLCQHHGTGTGRCRLCGQVLPGVLFRPDTSYLVDGGVHPLDPLRGGTRCAQWHREGLQDIDATPLRAVDSHRHRFLLTARGDEGRGVLAEA